MNTASLEPRPWSRRRWWVLVVIVFALHLGLIFAFSDRKVIVPRPPASAPILRLAGENEIESLSDPTLFALPHREGFAGATWLQKLDGNFQPFRWTEPSFLLALPVEKLGSTFAQFMRTNLLARFELEIKPAPELNLPAVSEVSSIIPTRSILRVAGGLANRRLLNSPNLRSWPATDLLTNNVVQVLVNADGEVISATLLCKPPGSGSPDADNQALEIARASRFEPQHTDPKRLTFGTMIFEWRTEAENPKPTANP